MKRFIICAFIVLTAFFGVQEAFSAPKKIPTVAVLSDTGHRNGTTYLICGAASDIIAADIINRLNQTGRVNAPLLGENMSKITQRNIPLYYLTFFREYKYNYNIDFVNLKRVTKNLNADYILMVTSGLDTQSEFLKETWWSKWGISSSEPLVPTYKLTTLVTLIDKQTYSVVWQDLYQRQIKAKDMDLGIVQFSPSYSQLSKIKKYSKNMSEYVVNVVDKQVNPWIVPPDEPKALEMKSRFLNEGTKLYYPSVNGEVVKENITDFKDKTNRKIEKHRMEREIKKQKNIENVNYVKQQKQSVQTADPKKDERLFDSIRNNIDDVSNTLPPPKEETRNKTLEETQEKIKEEFIKPAVDISPKRQEPELIKPIMNKPETKVTEPKEPVQQELPMYDWNLKNIYLQKIGKEKKYKRTAQKGVLIKAETE